MAYGDVIGWPGSLHDALDSFLIQDFTAPKAHFRLQSLRFIVSHELKDTGDENISGFGTRTSFQAGPEYLLDVLGRLNFSFRGPKHLPCLGKNQAERAPYYWPAYKTLGVLYPKWMSWKRALTELISCGNW